jgi:hypothetical protein
MQSRRIPNLRQKFMWDNVDVDELDPDTLDDLMTGLGFESSTLERFISEDGLQASQILEKYFNIANKPPYSDCKVKQGWTKNNDLLQNAYDSADILNPDDAKNGKPEVTKGELAEDTLVELEPILKEAQKIYQDRKKLAAEAAKAKAEAALAKAKEVKKRLEAKAKKNSGGSRRSSKRTNKRKSRRRITNKRNSKRRYN